ncbi:MAG: hypothetical protein JRF63_08220 [Deltaproteobacteria bacterium]|nr:hypothetical protein [Deltaproteobacteria bacterium]
MGSIIETVLLLALPASGKSELRRYLDLLPPKECESRYHLGPTAQLDDYPYVHLMRVIDDSLADAGEERRFFEAPDRGFADPVDWETLIALVNEDYSDMAAGRRRSPEAPASWMLQRIDRAREAVGANPALAGLTKDAVGAIERAITGEVEELVSEWNRLLPQSLDGKTVVIEFARGGPAGSGCPLPEHFGYLASLKRLSAEILERASILYVWVTPEQSRAKNLERARPDADGSILFHGVPEHVMRNDYGCDDIGWLLEHSDHPGTARIESRGRTFHVPAARFDNRTDLTTFLRGEKSAWESNLLHDLETGLGQAFGHLWKNYAANHR